MVGFLSDGDIMRYLRTEDHQPSAADNTLLLMDYFWNPDTEFQEKLKAVMDLNVLEIGTRNLITLPEDASLEDVCKLLSEAGVKKVPVVSGGKIVGIVSRSAVTQYLAKRYLSQGQAGVSA